MSAAAPSSAKAWPWIGGAAVALGVGYLLAYKAKKPADTATAAGNEKSSDSAAPVVVAAPKHKEYRKAASLSRVPSTSAPVATLRGADGPREHRFIPLTVDTRTADTLRLTLYAVTQPLYFTNEKAGSIPNEFSVITIQGGLTNQLYRAVLRDDSVLVRLYGAATERVIDRDRENLIMNLLSANGFGPALYGRFENGRLEQFLPGRSLKPDDMLDPVLSASLARAVGTMHGLDMATASGGKLSKVPSLFQTIDGWMELALKVKFDETGAGDVAKAKAKNAVLKSLNLPELKLELADLRARLLSLPTTTDPANTVFSHNDLLSGNVMYDEKSAKTSPAGGLRLIDFEYGCYNYRWFDIANHFCECCGFDCEWDKFPNPAAQAIFLNSYLKTVNASGSTPALAKLTSDELYSIVNPWVMISHLFWGSWAVVTAEFSAIDFDYVAYAKARIDGYRMMKVKLSPLLDRNIQKANAAAYAAIASPAKK